MNDLSLYSTTESGVDAFSTPETVTDAIANGTLTAGENVTDGETVVYAVNATGLSGYTAVRDPNLATGSDLDRLAGLEFTVSNESATGTDTAPAATANGTTVLPHGTGLFLVGNATETLDETIGTSTETDLTATFDVVDERLRAAAGSNASHTDSAPFTYVRNTTDSDGTSDSGETIDSDETVDSGDSTGSSNNSVTVENETTTVENDSATVENETKDVTDGSSYDGGSANDGSIEDTTDDGSERLETAGETAIDDGSDGNLDGTVGTTTETDSGDEDLDSDGYDGASGTDARGADDGGSGGSGSSGSSGGGGGSSGGGGGSSGGGGGSGTEVGEGAIGSDGDDGGSPSDENAEDADQPDGIGGRDADSGVDESRSDSGEKPDSTSNIDEGNEADASTDRGEGGIGSDGDAVNPESSSNVAADDVETPRVASSRAAEERTIRDRREIGPRPVADPNAPEEAEYVSRPDILERGSTPVTSAAANGHDDTSSSGVSDGPGGSLASSGDDRSARPPTFEEAPLRSTAYDVPGFGVTTALLAIAAASALAGRRETP